MEIQVTEEINRKLKNASATLGFNEQKIVERAILFYLDAVSKQKLNQEFEAWDKLSDEALVEFESRL